MSDPTSLSTLFPLLGTAFAAGAATQLARQLARPAPPRVRLVLALGVAAGIAALTVVALLTTVLRPPPAPALLLAAACVTGWSGPGILTRLGTLVERRLGAGGLLEPDPGPEIPPLGNETRGTYLPGRGDHTEA